MNDRFKFRGQTKKGKWIYGSLLWYADEPQIWDKDGNNFIVKTETVGQCTGLKNKNGNLIYEGDIIRQPDDCIGFIVWQGVSYWVESPGSHARDLEHSPYYESVEVIGNVYENPELLEEKC